MNPDLPDHETDLSRLGIAPHGRAWVMIREEWPKIRDDLDQGRLSPLGLVFVKSRNPFDVFKNHQVLAYAYELRGDDLWIFVYDPNTESTLPETNQIAISLNLANPEHTTHVGYTGTIPNNGVIWCFHRPDYSRKTPPAPTSSKLIEKVILSEVSKYKPAIASLDNQLYLAWTGTDSSINFLCSTDNGGTFKNKYTSTERTSLAPALCAHNGELFLAWKGVNNDQLNVARVKRLGSTIQGVTGKVTLSETSPSCPALASLYGRLYLAWRGGDNRLNVMNSTDNGATFGHKYTLPEFSASEPGLCSHNGELYLTWKGSGNNSINVAGLACTGDTLNGISNKRTLGDTSPQSPALISRTWLYLVWRGTDDRLNGMHSTDGGRSFGYKYTAEDWSGGTTGCVHNNQIYFAWIGTGTPKINIAHYV